MNQYAAAMSGYNPTTGQTIEHDADGNMSRVWLSGDMNCDGRVDFFDTDAFLLAAFDPVQCTLDFPNFELVRGDFDGDGSVTFLYIAPYLTVLFGGGPSAGANWAASRLIAAYEYDPYGGIVVETGSYAASNRWRFSTREFDPLTGLGAWPARVCDTTRWIGRDPIDEQGGYNLYTFVHNSPTNLIDLLGLTTILVSGIDPGNLNPSPKDPTGYLNACGYGTQPGAEKCGSHVTGGSILLGGGLDIKGHLEGDAERNKDCVSKHLGCKGCPCSKQRSIAIVMIAPKTTHTPQIDCQCCKLTFYILYDHEDIVPNGSQWAWDPGNTIFGNGFWKDNFTSGSCVSGTAIDVDFRDIPSHGTSWGLGGGVASGEVTEIHPHGGIWSGFNPRIRICDEIAKLRATHDDLIMCHSQGCNITMHAVNESCKQP